MTYKQLPCVFVVFVFLVILCIVYRVVRDPTAAEMSNLYSRLDDNGAVKTGSIIPGADAVYAGLKMY